jgi:hypothetical protein
MIDGTRPVWSKYLREEERSLFWALTGDGTMSKSSWVRDIGEAGVLVGTRVGALNGNGDGEFENGEVADAAWKGEEAWWIGEGSDWKEVRI